ncbi:MAG: hypothetical protein ACRC1H_19720, partial [Caldilineaceae bacterium]
MPQTTGNRRKPARPGASDAQDNGTHPRSRAQREDPGELSLSAQLAAENARANGVLDFDSDDGEHFAIAAPRSPSAAGRRSAAPGSESELDEFIHMGDVKPLEDDLFADIPESPDADEDMAPLPQIERDTKLEEEIEREKALPIEKL